jgi:hypothetical protein
MLVTSIQLAALHRARQKEHDRKPFFLFVDEMHSFMSLSFTDILAEARKYGLSLFLAHQYIEQVHENIRAAIIGNVGTIISFRIGITDAEFLAKEFHPVFDKHDFVNLPKYSMYLKLMIDGTTSKPFSANTNPLNYQKHSLKDDIIVNSQKRYGRKREEVEKEIFSKYEIRKDLNNNPKNLFDS